MNLRNRFLFSCIIAAIMLACLQSTLFAQTRGVKIVAVDDATQEWKEISLYERTYAVIIGIDRYPKLAMDEQLSYAVSDARAVERLLKGKFVFDRIYTLYNEQATKSNIMDLLLNTLSQISKNDAVFVFFAGHGGQEYTDFGPIGYLVPYDGDFSDMRKVISMTSIRDDISKRIKAKHVFYVMDACYSGLLVRKRGETSKKTRRDLAYLRQIAKEPVRQVLTAGDADQEVLDGGPDGHSVFTGRFLEILDTADDFITAEEISLQVKEKVFSDANARGHIQTPESGELFGMGNFIFMPSLKKRQGGVRQQISELEKELEEIRELEVKASKLQDETAQREIERRRQAAEAQLQAKKLEEERMEQAKLEKARKDAERQKNLEEQRQKQEEEHMRLATLTKQVEEKRKTYKSSMVLSLDEAIRELQSLDKQILDIKAKYLDELRMRILGIAQTYSDGYTYKALEKDEFETEAEYQARLEKYSQSGENSKRQEFASAIEIIQSEYDKQIEPLWDQMVDISNKRYTVYGHDALTMALGKYNADRESFALTVASKNIGRPIYPLGRMRVISKSEGQAERAGIRKGDIIIKYNDIPVTASSNWDQLKQTVITDSVVMEVERNGDVRQFTLKKGRIGVYDYVDDYAADLHPNQFLVNGRLPVPRTEARRFKQNYLNGFVTAEVEVRPVSPACCMVTKAIVIDESNDKRYDLFKSRIISFGHRLTYDSELDIFWLTRIPNPTLSLHGAEKYLRQLTNLGLDWRLPTLEEMKSLRDTYAYWYFNFPDSFFHTSPRYEKRNDQYNPKGNRKWSESIYDRERFLALTKGNLYQGKYSVLYDRFILLKTGLVFDTTNKLIWLQSPASNREMTWIEANEFLKEYSFGGLKGWRLPTYNEFRGLYDYSIPGLSAGFNFPDRFFHTAPKQEKNRNDQYNPRGNRKWRESCNDTEMIVGVM